MTQSLTWVEAGIDKLNAVEFHHLMKLRIDVFVVEQACIYPELDGQDALSNTHHVFAAQPESNVVAAARILAPSTSLPVRIGRVVVAPEQRGTGLSDELMSRVMRYCEATYPGQLIELSAQVGAEALYQRHGFAVVSKEYLEDGIPHWDMRFTP